jgi:hypothetical protein
MFLLEFTKIIKTRDIKKHCREFLYLLKQKVPNITAEDIF